MDLLGLKRKALGHCLRDRWGDSSSNTDSSGASVSTSTSGYTTAGSSSTSLGNISSGSSVSSYSYDSSTNNFVQDAVVAGTAPGADPNSTQTTLAELSGVASSAPVASGAPVGVASAQAKGDLPRALLTLGSFVLGFLGLATPAAPGAALGLGKMFYNGEHTKMMKDFGSVAPTTNVATGSGAAAAASYFTGDSGGERRGSSYSGFYSSPVIGYQGALVNQPNSPALATANLGTSKAATSTLKLTPAGVSTTQQAETPWTAILVTVGLVAFLS